MTDEEKRLVFWFLNTEQPQEPFNLDDARNVFNPAKFYAALHREIETRETSPRWKNGATQADLRTLKNELDRQL
jgi:hypothetical protein